SPLIAPQLVQAKKALELAELKFKAGTLTNLDLLDSENAESEVRLQYLKVCIEKALISYKLKAALGNNLY
ncbi:MAG: TolC family protein, partial [Marinilabiliales bacterium]|nr:TolC family protein [Marinilabiliales bacterium]